MMAALSRRARTSLLCMVAALALAFGLVACRELTAPVRNSAPEFILARGQVLGPGEHPVSDASVDVRPQSGDDFSLDLHSDEHGMFEAGVPNIPLRVVIRPKSADHLPDMDLDFVRFQDGTVRKFLYPGKRYSGFVGLVEALPSIDGGTVYLSTRWLDADGSLSSESDRADFGADGSFEVYLPHDGLYHARVGSCCPTTNYEWPDSLEVVDGGLIRLDLPVVPYQIVLTLHGAPLPPGSVTMTTRTWGSADIKSSTDLECDGEQRVFDVVGFREVTRCDLAISGNPSPPISGAPEVRNFLPQTLVTQPLAEGDVRTFELGEYELQVQLVDPQGLPGPLTNIYLESEDGMGSGLELYTDVQGRAVFRVNPAGYRLVVDAHDPYEDARRYFVIDGDTQMLITLQPRSAKEATQ